MPDNTIQPQTLNKPLVIPLIPPRVPGSAIQRWLWDMFTRGLIDVPASEPVHRGRATSPLDRTPTEADGSPSDSGETTAHSTDNMSSSEDTFYASDATDEVTDKLGCIAIAVAVNEGSSFTKGTRVNVRTLPDLLPQSQRYLVRMDVLNQPVADIDNFKTHHGNALAKLPALLELDDGSNTTWFLGSHCRQFFIERDNAGGRIYSVGAWTKAVIARYIGSPPISQREVVYDHACIHCKNSDPTPEGLTTGIAEYGDKSGAAVLLHDRKLTLSIPCYNWDKKSWDNNMVVQYRPAVAYAVTAQFYGQRGSGMLGFGPMRRQSAFGSAVNRLQAPAFLETLQSVLPPADEDGIIVYLALRPIARYLLHPTIGYQLSDTNAAHWMSFNGWPCRLQPDWSGSIYLAPEALLSSWKVRLLSMTFRRNREDTDQYEPLEDPDAGTITFGDNGLLVHIDCGSSISLVPPNLVRHLRTKVWPIDENLRIDTEQQDTPCSLENIKVPFYIPHRDAIVIDYKFADGRGGTVTVSGPGDYFLGQINPDSDSSTTLKEGLIFIGPPDIIQGEAIFGMNFCQTMFIAFHNLNNGQSYVTLAPQWERQIVQFSPLSMVDSN